MPISTIGHELFEMAIEMEAAGEDFYRALALGSDNPDVREFCLRTGREEAGHQITLRELRDNYAGSRDPGWGRGDRSRELSMLARREIQPDPRATRRIAMGGDLKSALALAIRMEQNAIAFYRELLFFMPGAVDVLELLIAEEEKHLASLQTLAI